jgi:chaperonin cofactor prefoldin
MPRKFQPPNRSLNELRDKRDDLRVRLSLLEDNRLSSPAELLHLKQEIASLEHLDVTRASNAA